MAPEGTKAVGLVGLKLYEHHGDSLVVKQAFDSKVLLFSPTHLLFMGNFTLWPISEFGNGCKNVVRDFSLHI